MYRELPPPPPAPPSQGRDRAGNRGTVQSVYQVEYRSGLQTTVKRRFVVGVFSWLKVPTSAFTFKTLLRLLEPMEHYTTLIMTVSWAAVWGFVLWSYWAWAPLGSYQSSASILHSTPHITGFISSYSIHHGWYSTVDDWHIGSDEWM